MEWYLNRLWARLLGIIALFDCTYYVLVDTKIVAFQLLNHLPKNMFTSIVTYFLIGPAYVALAFVGATLLVLAVVNPKLLADRLRIYERT